MELPKGWAFTTVGEIAQYINGRAFKPQEWEEKGLPIIRIQNLNNDKIKYNYTTKIYEDKYKVEYGDLLFAWSASLGAYIWRSSDAWLNQHIFKVIPFEGVDRKFMFYVLTNTVEHFYSKTHGSGMVHITKSIFEDTQILLPPFPEQQRIVEKIDALFSELDKGVEILQIVKEQLKTYRQSVLNQGFEGNEEETKTTLSEIAEIVGGITKGRNLSNHETVSLPYLRVANVQDGYLDLSTVKEIELKKDEVEKYILHVDDVLYTEGGDKDKLGRGTIWKGEILNCVHQNHIFRARINSHKAIPKYVALYSRTRKAKSYFFSKAKQTVNLASINMTVLKSLPISLPPKEKQIEIISDIDIKLSYCDKLEQLVDENLAKADALRQSILKKAFEGRLVPQDPNDEPAEMLLERIKAERAAAEQRMKQQKSLKRSKKNG